MLVVLAAMQKEANFITYPDAKVIVTGIGGANVIKTLSAAILDGRINKDDRIVNVGYAGSSIVHIGGIVSIFGCRKYSNIFYGDNDKIEMLIPYEDKDVDYISTCLTADTFVEDADGTIIDMELYYIRLFFPRMVAFKLISDNLNYKSYAEFEPTPYWTKINDILRRLDNGKFWD